jgi:hypothetical protein
MHPYMTEKIAEQHRKELETDAAWLRLRRATRANRRSDPTVTPKRRWTIRRSAPRPVVAPATCG